MTISSIEVRVMLTHVITEQLRRALHTLLQSSVSVGFGFGFSGLC